MDVNPKNKRISVTDFDTQFFAVLQGKTGIVGEYTNDFTPLGDFRVVTCKILHLWGEVLLISFRMLDIYGLGIMQKAHSNNNIGTCKSNIEKDARVSQKIDNSWQVAKSTTNTMSAMLFYDENISDYIFSIYENRKGLSFGYFFRGGGSTNAENEGIAEYRIEGCNEKAYLSMNKQQVAKIEIDNVEIIEIDHTKPFAIVLPVGIGAIKIYDKYGNVLQTIPQTL